MRAFALAAANDMDMGTAARTLEKPGNEDFVCFKNRAADRAYPGPISPEAVNAAPDMHKPVFPPVQGREGQGTYQFSVP